MTGVTATGDVDAFVLQWPMDLARPHVRLVEASFHRGQVRAGEHFTRVVEIEHTSAAAMTLVPAGMSVVASHREGSLEVLHARGPEGGVMIRSAVSAAVAVVSACSAAGCDRVVDELRRLTPSPRDDGAVQVHVWFEGRFGLNGRPRRLQVPRWCDIADNYPPAVRSQIQRMTDVRPAMDDGRLIIWHGEPGTGKTNAIRALVREWAPWCTPHYLAEPEAFFASAAHIDEVLNAPDPSRRPGDGTEPKRWRLIIAEDTDELLRAERRGMSGGALGRLFNLADGLLGQGLEALFLITTNEPIHEVHPALVRPGRCLSRIEFGRFTSSHARQWLPAEVRSKVAGPMTLAELYELRGDHQRIEHRNGHHQEGAYL